MTPDIFRSDWCHDAVIGEPSKEAGQGQIPTPQSNLIGQTATDVGRAPEIRNGKAGNSDPSTYTSYMTPSTGLYCAPLKRGGLLNGAIRSLPSTAVSLAI